MTSIITYSKAYIRIEFIDYLLLNVIELFLMRCRHFWLLINWISELK